MPKQLTPACAYQAVRKSAETIRNAEPATIAVMSAGDVARQGDLYIVALDRQPKTTGPAPRQLAPGSTQGSRHVAEGDCDVLVADEASALSVLHRLVPATKAHQQFVGPIIVARGPVTITHPEHGHRTLPGDSVYLVLYQRSWQQELRRQQD